MTLSNLAQVQTDWDVYDNSGEHLGKVRGLHEGYFILEKGMFLPKDYYVPADGIRQVNPDKRQVFVNCSKGDIDSMGWDQIPTWSDGAPNRTPTEWTTPATSETDTQRMALHEESLRAEKTTQQTGEARLTKHVTEEQQDLEVPVTREGVEVRRYAVDRPATAADEAFQEGETIRVPVREEQVQVTKEPRVVEEVELRKTARQDPQRVSGTVRKEQVDVEPQGDVDMREGGLVGAGADRTQGMRDWDEAGVDQTTRRGALDEDADTEIDKDSYGGI